MKKNILARNILLMANLERAAKQCLKSQIELIALKGAAFFLLGIFDLKDREMTDIDVLIKRNNLKQFENILFKNGFERMENSADSFILKTDNQSPPVIFDIHTNLYHAKNIKTIWKETINPKTDSPNLFVLKPPQMLAHIIAHPFLHHGFFSKKNKTDLISFIKYARKNEKDFWGKTAKLCSDSGLNPFAYHALRSVSKKMPESEKEKIVLFKPRGLEKFYSPLVQKALKKHNNLIEYLLPVLYKPKIIFSYLFPSKEFLVRRFGNSSVKTRIKRPFRILWNIVFRDE